MDKYLLEILKKVNTIIIPGLGALTITDATTGEILFMPYLNYDDGKLAEHIADQEGMSKNDATNLISKYVREIEAKLNVGESYDMYKFGSFHKNNEGEIAFKSWGDFQIEKAEKERQQIAAITPVEIHPVSSENEILSEKDVVVQVTSNSTEYSTEEQWNDDLDLPPINHKIERPKQAIIEKAKADKPKRRKGIAVILTLLVLIIGCTLTYSLFYNSVEKPVRKLISKKELKTTKINSSKENVNLEQEKIVSQQLEQKNEESEEVNLPLENVTSEIENTTTERNTSNNYHIVMGAFKNKQNAENYVKWLNDKGASSSIIAQMDGLFLVSYGSYASIEDRRNNIVAARQISQRAWLLIYP
jgi:cell division septation protein DedD